MKKAIFLSLSFSLLATQYAKSFIIEETISDTRSCTKQNEKRLRNMLYNSYARDNTFYKKKCPAISHSLREKKKFVCSYELFSNIDYFITILEDHIKKLEKKLSQPKRFFRYSSFYIGLAFLSLGAALSNLTYLSFYDPSWPKKEDYMEKITDFQKALKLAEEQWMKSSVASDFLWEYRRCQFDSAEKHCFRYFNDFERAQCVKNFKTFEQRFQYVEVYNIRKYIDDKSPYVDKTGGLLGASILSFVGAYMAFYKFCTSAHRYKKHLKYDKKLLAILKAEKYNPSEDRSRWCHF